MAGSVVGLGRGQRLELVVAQGLLGDQRPLGEPGQYGPVKLLHGRELGAADELHRLVVAREHLAGVGIQAIGRGKEHAACEGALNALEGDARA